MQHETTTLEYEVPPPKPATRPALVAFLFGLICLILEIVNEVITVVPSRAAEQSRWRAGYVLLALTGLLFGFAIGHCFAARRSQRVA